MNKGLERDTERGRGRGKRVGVRDVGRSYVG